MGSYDHVQRMFEGFGNAPKPPIPPGFRLVGKGGESFELTPDCAIATPDSAGHHVGLNVGYGKLSNGRFGIQTFDEEGSYSGVAYFETLEAAKTKAVLLVKALVNLGPTFETESVEQLLKAVGIVEHY